MECPVLTQYRKSPLHAEADLMRLMNAKGHNVIINATIDVNMEDDYRNRIGEILYYRIGSECASRREWNSMTFLQLEYEARVQGSIGPKEQHSLTEWRLRLMLEIEARQIEAKEPIALQHNVTAGRIVTPSIMNKDDNLQDKVEQDGRDRLIFMRKNGIKTVV